MAHRRKKSHGKKRHHKRRGVSGLPKDILTDVASAAAGVVGATLISKAAEKVIPATVTDQKTKTAIQNAAAVAGGIALVYFGGKNEMMKTTGLVMAGVGVANLAKDYIPGLSGILGEDPSSLQDELQEMFIEGGASSLQENPGGYSDYGNQY